MFIRLVNKMRTVLVLLLGATLMFSLSWGALTNCAIAGILFTPNTIAYDINRDIDEQRKEETEKRYGEDAGKVVDEALENNKESANTKYRVKQDDSLPKRANKVIDQVKDRGLVGEETRS